MLFVLGAFSPATRSRADADAPATSGLLVETGELQARLAAGPLRALDTRPPAEYAKGHIPGAVRVDVKAWQRLGGKQGGWHDAAGWGEAVGRLGVGTDTAVVVYGGSPTDAARVWWTLKYLGVRDVAILDGGWGRWVGDGRPSETATPEVKAVKFEPKFQSDRLEEIDALKKSIRSGTVAVVDARTAGEFAGTDVRGKRGGHLPGAKHLEWKELLADDGRFKSPEQLRALFHQRGIRPEQTAVTC